MEGADAAAAAAEGEEPMRVVEEGMVTAGTEKLSRVNSHTETNDSYFKAISNLLQADSTVQKTASGNESA